MRKDRKEVVLMVGLELPSVCGSVRAARVILQGPATEAWTRSPYTSRAVSRYSYWGGGKPFPVTLATSCTECENAHKWEAYRKEGKAGLGESTVGKITLSHTQWCAGHSMVVERTASTRSPDGQNPLVLDLISGIPGSGHLSSKFIPSLLRWSLSSALWGWACDLLMKQQREAACFQCLCHRQLFIPGLFL